jgi:diguanylate cyclase (GGDEF)-like protein
MHWMSLPVLNWPSLPDLVYVFLLVVIFRSLLARKEDSKLRYWLIGWIFIFFRFVAIFFDMGQGLQHHIAYTFVLVFMIPASAAFIMANHAAELHGPGEIFRVILMNIGGVLILACYAWDVKSVPVYAVLAVLSLVAGLAGLLLIHRVVPVPRPIVVNFAVQRILLLVVLYAMSIKFAASWVLFTAYLDTGLMFLNEKPTSTGGVGRKIIIIFLFVWASCYLIGPLIGLYGNEHLIQSEVWSLPKFMVAIGMLLALLEERLEHHKHLSLHDELTGLPNRRLLEDRLLQAIARADRDHNHVALLSIDLDRFKEINDTLGHLAGDQFLCAISARFQRTIRRADTIARTGGDEFSVVIGDLPNRQAAQLVIRSLQQSIVQPVNIHNSSIQMRASIGMALYSEDGSTIEALTEAADTDMYRVKRLNVSSSDPGISPPLIPFPNP